jgi:anion-transporting  ArsA/GET3 family ATPase
VDYLCAEYAAKGRDLRRMAIVFGGKRPALFVKRELARRIKTAFYPPRFFTIDEFVSCILRKKENLVGTMDLDSCYLIYNLARELTPEILKGRETFAQFLPWTREVLRFIDQLDLEQVENSSLEKITANAEIGYPVPEDVNRLLKNIVVLRQAFLHRLKEAGLVSRGLQYHRAAEVVSEVSFDEFDDILFCNFFYLNKSEELIIKSLYERGPGKLIFQGDSRKWPTLAKTVKNLGVSISEGKEPELPKFNLKLYAARDGHAQVGLVREILKTIKNLNDTVIVLPNPDHIIPLLSEMTGLVQDFNISMGYSLKRSSLYSLLEFTFQAQLSTKDQRYYARDYLKAIRHPFVKNLNLTGQGAVTRILIHKIEEILTGKEMTALSGRLFFELNELENLEAVYDLSQEMLNRLEMDVSRDQMRETLGSIHEILFRGWEDANTFGRFSRVLERFLNVLIEKSFMHHYPLNMNIVDKVQVIIEELKMAAFKDEDFTREDIFKIFDSRLSREIVAFQGSPLKGLQVLGLFETRSLNFENVICLDMNEGVMPRLNMYEPLIPREVLVSLGLDRLELEEEIQRYQFLRLISSAKNVHLVYQQSKEKERSRFVEELIWDEEKKQEAVNVVPVQRAGFQVFVSSKKREVEKTPAMIEALRRHSYSASSVNTYLRNPMEFYTKYVLGLKEQDDLLDEPEARHVGTFVHELLEHSFKPFINKPPVIDNEFRSRFANEFDRRFDEVFGRTMQSDSFLLRSVLIERMNRFLDNEQFSEHRRIEKILYLENRFEDVIRLSCGDIRFACIVDRVDQLADGTVMIIDYKTGSIDQMPRAIEQIAAMNLSREAIRDQVKSFQIPLYFHYLRKEFSTQPINAALYNLRTLELKPFLDRRVTASNAQIDEVFMRALDFTMSEILDSNVPFVDDPQ